MYECYLIFFADPFERIEKYELSIILEGMRKTSWGYEEMEHTADWELHVWAASMEELFIAAAFGMNSLAGLKLESTPRIIREVVINAGDPETMLVSFLSELLYFSEMDGLGFDNFQITIAGDSVSGILTGAPIESIEKEIKAVTYHNLEILKTQCGLEARIVFDV